VCVWEMVCVRFPHTHTHSVIVVREIVCVCVEMVRVRFPHTHIHTECDSGTRDLCVCV